MISKEIRRAEREYVYTPPPINALVTARVDSIHFNVIFVLRCFAFSLFLDGAR